MTEVFDATPTPEPSDEPAGLPSPSEYLASIVRHHQLIFVGDRRCVAEHLAVVRDSIGPLHQAGVANLAWEFTNSRAQTVLDDITTASSWNRKAASDLFVDLLGIGHGYEEYLDVIHAVWEHNQQRDPDWPPFRLIGLGLPTYVEDPDLLEGRSAGETSLRNWWMGGHYRDVSSWHMANTLTAEVLRKGERAVVYCDGHRSTTKFVSWIEGMVALGPGNLLHNWMGEGVARVVFHGAIEDDDALARIEELVEASPDPESSFGLDLSSSTLGNVRLHGLSGSIGTGARSFDLSDVADGYLFVAPRASWTPTGLIPDLIHPSNFEDAEARYRALDPREEHYTLDELEEIRLQGLNAVPDAWPADPTPDASIEETKKRRFRRS